MKYRKKNKFKGSKIYVNYYKRKRIFQQQQKNLLIGFFFLLEKVLAAQRN